MYIRREVIEKDGGKFLQANMQDIHEAIFELNKKLESKVEKCLLENLTDDALNNLQKKVRNEKRRRRNRHDRLNLRKPEESAEGR